MAYCGPRGIPLSVFLSWPQDDQQAALAWQLHENRRCRDCGTHPEDWPRDPKKHRHHVEIHRCEGCARLQQVADTDRYRKGGRGLHLVNARGPAKACPTCNPPPS